MAYKRRPSDRRRHQCCAYQDQAVDNSEDVDEAEVFGEKAGYWEKHNELTDKYDEDMMERLNSGLDNLLIFVSVLSTSPRRMTVHGVNRQAYSQPWIPPS